MLDKMPTHPGSMCIMTLSFSGDSILIANSLDGHRDYVAVQRHSDRTAVQLLESVG